MARLWTLLALVAVLLMPLGMAGSAAMAAPAPATASGHCDEHQRPADAPAGTQAHCTGCVALPALDSSPPSAQLLLKLRPSRRLPTPSPASSREPTRRLRSAAEVRLFQEKLQIFGDLT